MAERWKLRTVVLDLDDTVYPEREFVLSGFVAVDAWLRARGEVEGFLSVATRLFRSGARGNIFDLALAELGVAAEPSKVGEMLAVYREHEPAIHLAPDAGEVLPWLASEFNLAALSDGYATVQRRKFAALGLDEWIDFSVFTDEIGRAFWKPHPAGFVRVMQQWPGSPDGYLYVADNPRKDFIAPRELGWRTVRIRRPDGEHATYVASSRESAEQEIVSLAELSSLIEPDG